jgi:hypothetical protein
MNKVERPFFPIVYVRGYAMTQSEIGETVATLYMGFNEHHRHPRETDRQRMGSAVQHG